MQSKLTIALAAAAFALASSLAFAADMPADGTKNFTAPGDAPSYFTNETVPASDRVANQATFTEVEDATASEPEPIGTDRGSKRASARKSTKHASGKSKASGGSAHYTKARSSKATRSEVVHTSGTRSASAAKGSAKSGTPAVASRVNTTKHAKSGIRQQAAVVPPPTAANLFA
jgi:hypothetical protein